MEQSTDPDDLCDIAQTHHEAGRLVAAETLYQTILQIDPGHPGALYFLGGIAFEDGRYALAETLLDRLVSDNPGDIEALHLRGLIAAKLAQPAHALELINRALALQPQYLQAHYSCGDILQTQSRFDEAITSFQHVLALNPNHAEAHCNIGHILKNKHRLDEAAASYRRASLLKPDLDIAFNGLGQILQMQGKFAEAIANFEQALALKPGAAEYLNGLGTALLAFDHARVDDAIICYQNALTADPESAELHNNLGVALMVKGDFSAAVASYRQALALKPDDLKKLLNFSQALIDANDLAAAADCLQRVLKLEPNHVAAFSSYLAVLQYLPGYSLPQLFADHVAFGERFAAPLRAQWPNHDNVRDPQRRLKIGFVSGDLNTHPVGFFLESVLAHFDRRSLDITFYPSSDIADALTDRLRALGDSWTALTGLSDVAAAQRITADRIDILIDLSGHTKDNRLLVFARKPAPVQAAWLGYWASTGLQAIDYILCDRHGIPEHERRFYVEQPCYLPDTRLCFTPPTEDVAVQPPPALANGYVTFGCFNNLTKMTDTVVMLWAQILQQVPTAKLLLKSKAFADAAIQYGILARFTAHGIGAERLLLEQHEARAAYLAAYHRVDIALDPFPFTGGTTTIEGLWMGVPVVTLRGDRMIAHQGEGIVRNVGLADWIADDEVAYVAQAVARANDLMALAALREQLRGRLLNSPLCDAKAFARHFEIALRGMWQTYCEQT